MRGSSRAKAVRVTGLILAGGEGRRVGGEDKGLLPYRGLALIDHVLARLEPQVTGLIISANRSHTDYLQRGVTVLEDRFPGYLGPMAGIATGLSHCETDWMQLAPCDGPHLPTDLVARLTAARLRSSLVVVPVSHDLNGQRLPQYPFMLVHRSLAPSAADYLLAGRRRLRDWAEAHRPAYCLFRREADPRAFCNLNTHAAIGGLEGDTAFLTPGVIGPT
ncbi:MAG: molybdenum cofactor guanylyltransferase MobA [Burkholderiaceae bacterium]